MRLVFRDCVCVYECVRACVCAYVRMCEFKVQYVTNLLEVGVRKMTRN